MKTKINRTYLAVGGILALALALLGYLFTQEKVFSSAEVCDQTCQDNFGQAGTCVSDLADNSKVIGTCDFKSDDCVGDKDCKCSCHD